MSSVSLGFVGVFAFGRSQVWLVLCGLEAFGRWRAFSHQGVVLAVSLLLGLLSGPVSFP